MNEQVTTDASGTPTTVAPITSSTTNTSGALSNVQTGQAKPITMAQMYPAQPITVPTAPATPNPAEATAASAAQTTKTLDQYIKELTPTPTATSQQYESLLGELNNLLPGLTGRGSDQLAAETQAGLPDLKQKLAGLNAQILSKVAELTKSNASYEQLIANLENPANAQQQGIPMSAIIGQQAQARKAQLAEANSKSADLGLLQAVASGMQGNIQAMQQGIDRAIDLKYQDRESTVNLKMQQLQLLEGKLNKEEAIQKAALERKYNEEREKLAEEKAKAKENINLAFSANVQTKFTNKGGEFFRVSDGKSYSDPAEFFRDAGVTSFQDAYSRGLVTDVSAQRLADIGYVSQLRAKYSDAGIAFSDTASDAEAKVARNSKIYREETRPPQYAGGSGPGTLAGTPIIDKSTDSGVRSILLSRPGDGGWGDAYKAVADKFGKAVADKYNGVFDYYFRQGTGIDAAFNNMKLASMTPEVKLTAAQKGNVSDWNTLIQQVDATLSLGSRINYGGIGSAGTGTIKQFLAKQFGAGSPEEEQLRNLVSNVRATIAKARGGTSFTANEEKLLDSYVPTINDSPLVIKSKLASLKDFAARNISNIYSTSGGTYQAAPDGSVWQVNPDGTLTQVK